MRISKKLSIILSIALVFSIAGCAEGGSSAPEESSSAVKVEKKEPKADSSADSEAAEPEPVPEVSRSESEVELSAPGGVYAEGFELTLSAPDGGKLYYTTDGSDPATSDTRIEYTAPIAIASRENDKNVVSAVSPTLISGNFNNIDYGEKAYVCEKSAPADSAVDKCTVIRACSESGGSFSKTATATYYIGTESEHIPGVSESVKTMGTSLAVISISMDYDDLFDPARGIYVKGNIFDSDFKSKLNDSDFKLDSEGARQLDANYKQRGREWERPCHIDFFEFEEGETTLAVSQDCGVRVQGNYSRSDLIKGLRLFARKEYGQKRFEYDVFHGKAADKDGAVLESFKTLTLRAGGNCAFTAKFNDTYWQDMSRTLDCATKASRPCVVYLNGEYWGLYVLEENYDDDYFEDHYGVDKDSVVVYKGDAETYSSGYKLDEGELPEGETDEDYYFKELKSFFRSHKSLKAQEDYDEFAKLVDTKSVMDYFLSEVWINNKWDWPGKNWSMWKTSTVDEGNEYADGRWRLMFYDMEFGGVSGESDARANTVKDDNYKPKGLLDMDTSNPAVLSFAYLMTNDAFREEYNERLLSLSEGIYKKETLLSGLSQYESEYGPLYEQFFERYPDTGSKDEALSGGYASSKCIRDFLAKREDNIQKMVDWINRTLS